MVGSLIEEAAHESHSRNDLRMSIFDDKPIR